MAAAFTTTLLACTSRRTIVTSHTVDPPDANFGCGCLLRSVPGSVPGLTQARLEVRSVTLRFSPPPHTTLTSCFGTNVPNYVPPLRRVSCRTIGSGRFASLTSP
jgi:hypothetical protein